MGGPLQKKRRTGLHETQRGGKRQERGASNAQQKRSGRQTGWKNSSLKQDFKKGESRPRSRTSQNKKNISIRRDP